MSKIITANMLSTGVVVFLGGDGSWTRSVAKARVFADEDSAEDALAEAKGDEIRALIVDPFITDKGPDTDGRPKMTLRDTIRAFGPTISYLPTDKPVVRG